MKDINVLDIGEESPKESKACPPRNDHFITEKSQQKILKFTTYKELDDIQLRHMIEFIVSFDKKFNLFNLEFNKLNDKFISSVCLEKIDKNNKHLEQISSIVSHVEVLLNSEVI